GRSCGDRSDRRRKLRPRVAAVSGFKDSHARFGVTRRIRFAGAGVECAVVEGERANRVGKEEPGEECPSWAGRKSVGGSPNSAASCSDPYPAIGHVAGRINCKGSDTTRSHIGSARKRQDIGKEGSARADFSPWE